MKKILIAVSLLLSMPVWAQDDKVERLYNEYLDFVKEGQYDSAVKKMRKLLGETMLAEDRFDYTMQLGSLYKDALANAKEAKKCFEAAHKLEKRILEDNPENLDLQLLLTLHYQLAVQADSAQNLSRLKEISDCGIRLYDNVSSRRSAKDASQNGCQQLCSMLYVCRAKALGGQGKVEEAMADYDSAQNILSEAISDPVNGNPRDYMLKWSFNVMQANFVANVMNDKKKAAEVAKRIVPEIERAIRIDNEPFRKELEKQGPLYISHIASACYEAGLYEECLQYCNDGLTWPDNSYATLIRQKRDEVLRKLNR